MLAICSSVLMCFGQVSSNPAWKTRIGKVPPPSCQHVQSRIKKRITHSVDVRFIASQLHVVMWHTVMHETCSCRHFWPWIKQAKWECFWQILTSQLNTGLNSYPRMWSIGLPKKIKSISESTSTWLQTVLNSFDDRLLAGFPCVGIACLSNARSSLFGP